MGFHLNGKFSMCGGGRGVDNVQFSVTGMTQLGKAGSSSCVCHSQAGHLTDRPPRPSLQHKSQAQR